MLPTAADEFRLCYIERPWAYFTTAPVTADLGEDWHKIPYEHNASAPRVWDARSALPRYELFRLAVEVDGLVEPREYHLNSPYSVEVINGGNIAWLRTDPYETARDPVAIMAGTPLTTFCATIEALGGTVYLPRRKETSP